MPNEASYDFKGPSLIVFDAIGPKAWVVDDEVRDRGSQRCGPGRPPASSCCQENMTSINGGKNAIVNIQNEEYFNRSQLWGK
ncbi:hypothetical protein BP5796_08855 [Coleophoma crateriformis]|uniref:Uncharacterized protein n=1 Tax=Coleophoma crateriformis TaxID=565419 RepID=A0A3D8R2M1_9HELO|nr:hypothetical protein BP5796_08855 [Coleophoma crateriformis]